MTEGAHPYRAEPDSGFSDRLEGALVRRLAASQLRRVGAADPDPLVGTLPDVDAREAGRSTVTVIDLTPTLTRDGRRTGRRSLVLVAAAAAAAVIVVAASVLLLVARDDPTNVEVPAGPSPVSVGPSPRAAEGATPSTPGSGELVAAFDQMGFAMDRAGFERTEPRHVYVYADGRVITSLGDSPSGFDPESTHATGFVEQRLTPRGVELVRAEILSTGLFDPEAPPPGSGLMAHDGPTRSSAAEVAFGVPPVIRVHDGDRFISLPKKLNQEWTDAFQQLQDRLWDLQSWLPASTWEDTTKTPYVPSTYAACRGHTTSIPTPDVVAALPAPAADLFTALFTAQPSQVGGGRLFPRCVDLTIDEARQLGEVLEAAGFTQSGGIPGGVGYSNHVELQDGIKNVTRSVSIGLTPQLPHGELAECCGGIG